VDCGVRAGHVVRQHVRLRAPAASTAGASAVKVSDRALLVPLLQRTVCS
jgi:hypothetical protein